MPAYVTPKFLPCGDGAVTVEFGDIIDPEINARALALDASLRAAPFPGVIETVATYRSVNVQFDPLALDYEAFAAEILGRTAALKTEPGQRRIWTVPVIYGGEAGLDLGDVAAHHKISVSRLIEIHSAAVYRCYMIGFMPGLAYLGGLDPLIAIPRRVSPRLKTPAGHIAIGGIQALISSVEMPSGWHLLGRTPVRTYMPARDPVFLISPGDEVIFKPVDASRWDALDRAAAAGEAVAELQTE